MKRIVLLVVILLPALSCAYQPAPPPDAEVVPGFFRGLLHGFLIFFSLIASIFSDVRVYSYPNAGFWYDAGYVLGASIFWGGGGAGARSSRRKR